MEPLNIVCFWWGNWCRPHGSLYVHRLYNMCKRHITLPFNFYCITDREEESFISDLYPRVDFNIVELPSALCTWKVNFPKIYVHCPYNGINGRVVVMDLDSVIVDNMDEMLSYDGKFCGVKPWRAHKWHTGGGLLSFEKEYTAFIWDKVIRRPKWWWDHCNGRERLLYRRLLGKDLDWWQDLFPDKLVGYKRHIRATGQLPKGAVFIAFHGKPRPHEVYSNIMREHWR